MAAPDIRQLADFLQESLQIEGIHRYPSNDEMVATQEFLKDPLTIRNVMALQNVYAPGMPLRDQPGMDVRVGMHVPLSGGFLMRRALEDVLRIAHPYDIHIAFEKLHPFMDGNGRTGRAIWLHRMSAVYNDPLNIGFLHRFYYQTLSKADHN